jgi:multicomponent Na+:H+ antiporter subunit A
MWLGPCFLGGLGILFGIIPWVVSKYLVQPAFSAVHVSKDPVTLALFHGINAPLLLSAATLSIGVILYIFMKRLRNPIRNFISNIPFSGSKGYDLTLYGLAEFAGLTTNRIQNGSLNRYLFTILSVVFLAIGGTLILKKGIIFPEKTLNLSYQEWLLILMVAVGSVAPVLTRSRLTAVCALGVAGAGVALMFLVFGAPDVALTQLLVETLTVIIVSIVMLRLPSLSCEACMPRTSRIRDGILSLGIGIVVTLLLVGTTAGDIDRFLTEYYEKNSYIAAHGRNIVNVILVDFRALDTMGEITVVALAAFAGYALIKLSNEQ